LSCVCVSVSGLLFSVGVCVCVCDLLIFFTALSRRREHLHARALQIRAELSTHIHRETGPQRPTHSFWSFLYLRKLATKAPPPSHFTYGHLGLQTHRNTAELNRICFTFTGDRLCGRLRDAPVLLDDATPDQDWLRCHEHPEAGGYLYIYTKYIYSYIYLYIYIHTYTHIYI